MFADILWIRQEDARPRVTVLLWLDREVDYLSKASGGCKLVLKQDETFNFRAVPQWVAYNSSLVNF